MVKPIWDKVEPKYPDIKFIEFVVDKDPNSLEYVNKFKANSVPFFVLTDDEDNVLTTWTGFTPEKRFADEFAKYEKYPVE